MAAYKKVLISIVLAVSLLAQLFGVAAAGSEGTFNDVPSDASYAEAVEALAKYGILKGDENGNFNPGNTLTRAEAAAVICRMSGVEEEAKSLTKRVFTDVAPSFWGAGYIAKAAELGVIGGYGNGLFGPNDPVTQAQMLKMLVCVQGYDSEAKQAGGWPNGYVSVGEKHGFTKGLQINGAQNATRATIAVMVYNALFGQANHEYEAFDGTYWLLTFGQTVGAQYLAKFYGDGTILLNHWLSFYHGKYEIRNGISVPECL